MSQLRSVQQQLAAIANDAKSTAQGLAGFKSKFSQAVSQVSATVGGSAQRVDQTLISALQTAEKELTAAIGALEQAAREANRYAQSL